MSKFDKTKDKYLALEIRIIFKQIKSFEAKRLLPIEKRLLISHVKDLIHVYNKLIEFYGKYYMWTSIGLKFHMNERRDRTLAKLKKAFELASIKYNFPEDHNIISMADLDI